MKRSLSTFFRGQSHFKVLQILCPRSAPARLRTIAELSGMYVRSVDLTLNYFTKRKLVNRVKQNGQILYSMNGNHPQVPLLRKIFDLIAMEENREADMRLDRRAQGVLAFSDAAIELFHRTKK